MSLLAELKRRNVIRMAGLYLVGAWLIVQVTGTVSPMLGAPEWVGRTVLALLAIGFPLALVVAWVFELTPEGLKRDGDVEPRESIAPQTARRMDRMIIVALTLALAFFAVDRFVIAPKREAALVADTLQTVKPPMEASTGPRMRGPSSEPAAAASGHTIAVMPFVNMSSDPEQEYFSDGMTEEVLNALANVPNLAVTARTSVFSLKGQNKDVREIGKLLGVAFVLEGSVRKAGDELRITAQLIRADNGFHLWSETYDRKLENVFDLQAELAGAIAKSLELPLGLGGDAALVSERSSDSQAYAMYLQARAAYRARGDGVKKSIELYREALKRDPKFAPAWAGLASSLAVLPWYVPEAERADAAASMQEAEAAGKQALALSPNLPQGHTALAMVYTFQWRWALAEQSFQRALELAPNDAELNYQYADWLSAVGRSEEALAAANKAVALDPLVPIFLNGQAHMLMRLGRVDASIEVRQAAYALAPELRTTTENLFYFYLVAGRLDEAEAMLDEIRSSALAEANRDPTWGANEAVQRVGRALIRVLRDPAQREAVREALDDQEYAGLLFWLSQLGSTPEDIDQQFRRFKEELDKHVNGVDPIVQLRSARYADYRKDPRYIRLLNMAGFDDEGDFR
jgi:TolB-like protein/Tfp pilus assembly protein PilF